MTYKFTWKKLGKLFLNVLKYSSVLIIILGSQILSFYGIYMVGYLKIRIFSGIYLGLCIVIFLIFIITSVIRGLKEWFREDEQNKEESTMLEVRLCYNGGSCLCPICNKISHRWELIRDCCPNCDSNIVECEEDE